MFERFKTKEFFGKEYRIDNYIFYVAIGLIIVLFFVTLVNAGTDFGNNLYIKCNSPQLGKCDNPVFNNTDICGKKVASDNILCTSETLPDGFSYGKQKPFLVDFFGYFVVGIISLAVLLNHFIYNRGKTLLNVPKEIIETKNETEEKNDDKDDDSKN